MIDPLEQQVAGGDKFLRADSYFDFYALVNQLVAEPLRAGKR